MSEQRRQELIVELEKRRQSSVICYLTSVRPGIPAQMADDQVRVLFDHLLRLPERPVNKLDVFLCSNGGSGTVPWRLASLFREFSKSFNVLIPYRAYSAATMLALGADEIVMHPFGELGPIDPIVGNDFNPKEEGTGRRLGISVEDVQAYVSFIKSTVGIRHEDELVQAIAILAQNVHPLALGNVERFLSQSRMIAKKIMRTRRKPFDDHTIDEIVENMTSRLYFHGHPINRREARDELGLKNVKDADEQLESLMWELYCEYEREFRNTEPWNPAGDLRSLGERRADTDNPATFNEKQYTLSLAIIESRSLSSRYKSRRTYREVPIRNAPPCQTGIVEHVLSESWEHQELGEIERAREEWS